MFQYTNLESDYIICEPWGMPVETQFKLISRRIYILPVAAVAADADTIGLPCLPTHLVTDWTGLRSIIALIIY